MEFVITFVITFVVAFGFAKTLYRAIKDERHLFVTQLEPEQLSKETESFIAATYKFMRLRIDNARNADEGGYLLVKSGELVEYIQQLLKESEQAHRLAQRRRGITEEETTKVEPSSADIINLSEHQERKEHHK